MNFLPRLRGRYRSLRAASLRAGARLALSLSTFQAQAYLRRTGPLTILVDTSVLGHGITHETAWIPTGSEPLGPDGRTTGYAARIPVHSPANDSRLYQEVRYLPGLARLARLGQLQLRTSAEIQAEMFRQPIGRFSGYGYFDLNVFRGIDMPSVDGHVLDLVDPEKTQLARVSGCTDPLFQALRARIGDEKSLDAYHILTAEQYNLSCFLHIDFPLRNSVHQNSRKHPISNLKTLILTPSELGRRIGLLPVNTNILSYEDSSFFVRPDLYWHNQRRNRPRKRSR